ncbi:putative RNA-directed DNA polymerase from transposon X-element [Araneus ventricosus]|uniref:Putative RNA-directed DNA polymerase from transposon X-element n=1 Tax=Araneus ventricosus TaxID=182803 RepID=A0A4Y2FTB1_ARAVE|nr:putative RNA-directed DNA polymerase from transposon X-element [Araneus ventricosus]
MLKHLGESSLLTILLLFNKIWPERVFPLSWLKAIVVPIPETGKDKQDPNNYRPIALTSCLSKLLERMVSARLMHVLERSKWFVPSQSGFRRRRNTIDNILKLETAIREAFMRKKHLVSIFFDIEKAYDRTWRYGILKDLSDIGLKGNLPLFIKNFLQTRIFQIRIGNILSDNFNQQEGVPQGSVPSVLLFIIKINGIVSKLPAYVNSTLFVDDIQIHCAGDDMGFIQRQLQTAINNMTDWASTNGFIFSPQKTVCMHFCRRRGLHPDPDFQLNGSPIPIVQETKFLGIVFDTKLTFRSHIKHLKTKCIRTLNIMKVLSSSFWGADKVSLMRIYRSLVRSNLDYGVPVYGSAAKSTLKMLDSVHHQGLHIATGAFRTTPIPSLHVISGEPSLELRCHRLSLSYFYKIKSDESHPQHYKVINPIFGESSYPNDFIAFKKCEEQKSVDFLPSYAEDYNSTFSYHELKNALRKSNPTSPGPDQIHNNMLKHLGESSLLTILLLFNKIWPERVFPLSWLKAIVVPIPETGKDKQDPNNYRPIALTSCLSKLLERMVSARLMHVLERSKWFVPSQSGFRRRRNTIDNILKLETAIREAFMRKKHLVSIFFDIEKAYDRTWRYGILKDLSDIGLKGNLPLFIKNFLQTRIFQIRIGNILSDNFNQQEGVPQGSVPSVLLFIIKINGIVSKLPAYVNSTLFVDDIQIHCAGDDMGFIQRQLQTAINNMTDWASTNGFIFSPQKTVCMHFCRRRGLHPDPDFQLNGSPIPIVQETKFLGIVFDTKLTFRSHIKHLKTKCIRTLNIMKVLSSSFWGADKVSLMRIYRSLVRSNLDYGVPVYGSAAKSTLKMLDSVHHQGLHIATGAFRTTPIPSLHVISGEPSLELRCHRLSLSYFYKIKSDESHPQHYKVINPIFGSLFSVRLSFTPTFGFRIGEILRYFEIEDFPVVSNVEDPPPWQETQLDFIDGFFTLF